MSVISWFFSLAAVLHAFEEYYYRWVKGVESLLPRVSKLHFIVVNMLTVSGCVVSALGFGGNTFSFSLATMGFLVTLTHLGVSTSIRRYHPGLYSAFMGYLPLSMYLYVDYTRSGVLSFNGFTQGLFLGVLWALLPLVFHIVRLIIDGDDVVGIIKTGLFDPGASS
ncbi:MAG: HXXEE domain-containing protein [Candidatus Bathyarchaeota archaeon]|nr:HXXEE domain-containing protein [Candidatus Bathyarchaeota archaeon]